MTEAKAKQDPPTRGAKAPPEKDPAKQTPDGQKRLPGKPKTTTTADSSAKTGKKADAKKDESTGKHSVTVSVEGVLCDVLDNLRAATSRKDYLEALVNAHLQAANPVGSIAEDDDLPGNEREAKSPVFRV